MSLVIQQRRRAQNPQLSGGNTRHIAYKVPLHRRITKTSPCTLIYQINVYPWFPFFFKCIKFLTLLVYLVFQHCKASHWIPDFTQYVYLVEQSKKLSTVLVCESSQFLKWRKGEISEKLPEVVLLLESFSLVVARHHQKSHRRYSEKQESERGINIMQSHMHSCMVVCKSDPFFRQTWNSASLEANAISQGSV